ncbi:uncharacterized protein LOC134684883 [Mytilus trossulus]|uniref:uncharacterized protein LOC134684883 n=1 Tax=Mytilus trossulus TaxID=6551 RepID=UPI00300705C3
MLNVRVVPDALRKYFDGRIPPANLATTINQNSTTIVNLVNRRVINLAQLDILQRIPGTIWPPRCLAVPTGSSATSSADFDVTLMVCLLRNIPLPGIYQPASGWDNLPIPSDKSPGAYLSRIKYYRNAIAHSTENKLNTLDFQGKWKTISEAITFCNGGHCPNAIMEILHCDLDGSQNGVNVTCLMTEIEAVKGDLQRTELQLENVQSDFHFYKDGHLPKNIADNINELINKWRIEDKPFFFTRAGKLVYDMLESENIVMIIGQSGSGKSATARHIALKWISNGYDVVSVESVEQILGYRCKGTKQIFVIDDAVGKYSVNGSYVNQWERLDSKLTTLFDDDNAKLICTLRKVVAIDSKFKASKTCLSEKAYIVDLDHEDNCLLLEEKMSILKNHLISTDRQNDISDEECKDCCKGNFAFPLLCHVFTTSNGLFLRKSDFFQKPFNYLNDEITKLHQRNKEVYCSLVTCMIFSGKLKVKLFSLSDDSDEEQEKSGRIIGMIAEACGLNRNISRQTLLDSLLSVESVYVKSYCGVISFLHDSFLEAISFHFSKVNPYVFLECCDIAFLKERVRVISSQVNDDENVIVLNDESFGLLANRFIAELKAGEFMDVLCSHPIRNEKFIKVMGAIIDGGQLITRQKLVETEISCVAYIKWKHFDPIYKQEDNVEAVAAIMEIFPAGKTLLHWLIATGCNYFVDFFFKRMSRKQQNKYIRSDKSIFSLALLGGCKEIIQSMLEKGANVNSLESQYALKKLVINGRDTKLLECLKYYGIGMHFIDYQRKSLLFYAITSKNLKIQTFLVEEDSQQHALHEAVFYSNTEKLTNLLSSHGINLVSNNGWSVMHFAAYKNDIAMMGIIFETAMKNELSVLDKRDKIGWSPLHLASILSNYKAVDFLMSKGANASSIDNDGKTPLHISGNEQITSSLLQYNRCSIEMSTRTERHSTELRHQHTTNNTNDINKTKDIAIDIEDVHTEMANTLFFSIKFIGENNIEFKQDEDKNWKPHKIQNIGKLDF